MALHSPNAPPPQSSSQWPCLMTLHKETSMVEFFDPVYNVVTTHKTGMQKLRGARIRRSKTFSCPPDSSSDCFVVGFKAIGYVPDVYIIKVGDNEWTYHYSLNPGKFMATGSNNLLFFKINTIYLLGDKGNLRTLCNKENSTAQRPRWKFYGSYFPSSKQRLIRKVYTSKDVDNGGMLAVILSREKGDIEVWRYKINGKELEREKITSLDNKTLFVSSGGSYLKTCAAPRLGNKIYFSMFHDNNRGVFYCLANHKYYSFDYSVNKAYSSPNIFNLVQPRSFIWIEPEND
ncbi:hypothetical protein H5410_060076 [Solanum commersonii]|uniref:KIB1-4 beta-propeller domain-containing protein n=1 Tax=Solanum commersonii TaxID=4109 RepID=A0A9J5W5G1_SOLCO|nr:hypothetical protein H5410_060076 [Solanum commersonii]